MDKTEVEKLIAAVWRARDDRGDGLGCWCGDFYAMNGRHDDACHEIRSILGRHMNR